MVLKGSFLGRTLKTRQAFPVCLHQANLDGKVVVHKIQILGSLSCPLISMKWQQTSGTAEQKVPFEIICLIEALEKGTYEKAYLVLGGEGWKPKLKTLYTSGGLEKYIPEADHVEILGLETFVAKANQGNL